MKNHEFEVKYELRYNPKSPNNHRENNLSTFFDRNIIKIQDETVHRDWEGDDGIGIYKLQVDPKLLHGDFSDEVRQMLKRLKTQSDPSDTLGKDRPAPLQAIPPFYVKITPLNDEKYRSGEVAQKLAEFEAEYAKMMKGKRNKSLIKQYAEEDTRKWCQEKGIDYIIKYTYFNTAFSPRFANVLHQLFISTMAYSRAGISWPDETDREGLTLHFDAKNMTATLTGVSVYDPDDPYCRYIRTSTRVLHKRTESQDDSGESVYNYYDEWHIGEWMPYDESKFLEKIGYAPEDRDGIYMLFDSEKKLFYIGESNHVFTRMKQHRDSKEGIRNFDYYRYSLIDPFYENDIFLIENAAIHDCAMLLKMPNNNKYNGLALADVLPMELPIQQITMDNRASKQTKRAKRK